VRGLEQGALGPVPDATAELKIGRAGPHVGPLAATGDQPPLVVEEGGVIVAIELFVRRIGDEQRRRDGPIGAREGAALNLRLVVPASPGHGRGQGNAKRLLNLVVLGRVEAALLMDDPSFRGGDARQQTPCSRAPANSSAGHDRPRESAPPRRTARSKRSEMHFDEAGRRFRPGIAAQPASGVSYRAEQPGILPRRGPFGVDRRARRPRHPRVGFANLGLWYRTQVLMSHGAFTLSAPLRLCGAKQVLKE
jgi:hypothetical protein